MANLATSGVTVNTDYSDGGNNGKRFLKRELTLVLSSMGTATNNISAAVLGFSVIKGSTPAMKSDDSVVIPTCPNTAGTKLLFGGGASNAPADYSGTFNVTVYGYSAL